MPKSDFEFDASTVVMEIRIYTCKFSAAEVAWQVPCMLRSERLFPSLNADPWLTGLRLTSRE
jgi:hypothetical protein